MNCGRRSTVKREGRDYGGDWNCGRERLYEIGVLEMGGGGKRTLPKRPIRRRLKRQTGKGRYGRYERSGRSDTIGDGGDCQSEDEEKVRLPKE